MALKAGRLRSRVRIWRPAEARSARGAVTETYAPAGKAWMGFQPPRRTLRDYGAGEEPQGEMEMEFYRQVDLRARDVVEVIAGPELGSKWRVLPVAHPRGEQGWAMAEAYTAPLPAIEEGA